MDVPITLIVCQILWEESMLISLFTAVVLPHRIRSEESNLACSSIFKTTVAARTTEGLESQTLETTVMAKAIVVVRITAVERTTVQKTSLILQLTSNAF
jgi:predicted cation transporter